MVSFVEQATLRVKDESSTPLRRINRELAALYRTAGRNLRVSVTGIAAANSQLNTLNNRLRSISGSRRIDFTGITQATARARSLNTALNNAARNRTANIRVNAPLPGGQTSGPAGRAAGSTTTNALRATLDTTGLRNVMNNSIQRMGHAIESAIIQGFQKAATERDLSATSLALLNLPAAQEETAISEARRISDEAPQFNEGQVRGVMAEVLRTTRFDQEAASILTEQAVSIARLQVLQGTDPERAIGNSFEFVKSAEQSGNLTDQAGNFSEEIAEEFFTTLKRNVVAGGQEITAELIRTLTKSLRVSRFGLNDRGFTTAIALAEEQGSTAGVGLNQAIKQLSGQGNAKFRIANLAELGLLTTEEVQTGTVAGVPITETRTNVPLENDLLRSDPAAWVRRYLMPAFDEAGVDLSNPAAVAQAVNDVVGDRTAVESVTGLILRAEELRKLGDLVEGLDVSDGFIQSLEDQSLVTAVANAQSGFENALGAASESMETVLIPALNKVGEVANAIANFIGGPDGEGSVGRTAAAVGGVAAAGGATFALAQRLNPFRTANLQLTTAGRQLQLAARALQAGAVGGALPGPRRATGRGAATTTGVGTGRGVLTGIGALGLLTLDNTPEAATARAEAMERGVVAGFEATGLGGIAQFFDERNEALKQRAREGDVSSFRRFISTINEPLPPADPAMVAARQEREQSAENNDTVERLIGVMMRNQERLAEPGRSEASVQSLQNQQVGIHRDIVEAGGGDLLKEALMQGFRELASIDQIQRDVARVPLVADTVTLMESPVLDEQPLATVLEAGSQEVGVTVGEAFNRGAADMQETFMRGGQSIAAAGDELEQAGVVFGPRAAQGLLEAAPSIGQAIGRSVAESIGNVNVQTRNPLPEPVLDTGAQTPF